MLALTPLEATAQFDTTLQPWAVTEVNLNTVQIYRVVFTGKGDVWGTGAPALDINESVRLGPYGLPTRQIGGSFEVCVVIDCFNFGASLKYGLNMAGGLGLQAHATAGLLNVEYPMYVTIEYPYWGSLRAGQKIAVKTSYAPERTAHMWSDNPRFFAKLTARADLEAGVGAFAEVFSNTIGPLPSWGFVAVHNSYDVFDTDEVFKSGEWTTFTIGPASGRARVPNLTASGELGSPENPKALSSYRSDGFLDVGVNVTNLVSEALAGVKLSDTLSAFPLFVEYHILEFAPSLGAAAEQGLQFVPLPRIEFKIDNNGTTSTVSVDAGQTLELRMPDDGSALRITPTIHPYGHFVQNQTSLFANAQVIVDPLRLKAGVQPVNFGPITVRFPSFTLNPFDGPFAQPVAPRVDLLGFERQFTLTEVNAPSLPGDEVVLSPDISTPRLVTVCQSPSDLSQLGEDCPKTLLPRTSGRVVFAQADGGFNEQTELRVNGTLVVRSPFSLGSGTCDAVAPPVPLGIGQFCFTIPGQLMTQPGTLRVQLIRIPEVGLPRPTDYSNSIDLQVLAETIPADQFNPPFVAQYANPGPDDDICDGKNQDGNFCLPLLGPLVAGAGPIGVLVQTNPLVSRGLPLRFIAEDAVLAWDGVPIQTSIVSEQSVTYDGATPVYATTYALGGLVPPVLQTGGTHTMSFINAEINARETVLEPIIVNNPVPAITSLLVGARSPAGTHMTINGVNFAPEASVEWDGVARPAVYQSSNLLGIALAPRDLTPGDHSVVVRNPTPGGGPSTAAIYNVPPVGTPELQVTHSLSRNSRGQITDVITFSNTGTGLLKDLELSSIKLHVGTGGYSANIKTPVTVPPTDPGGTNSLVVQFPAVGRSGQAGEIRIRGTLNGQDIRIDIAVTIP
jgi:hypothetical protein